MARPTKLQWLIVIHWDADHASPPMGPFGQTEADQAMREARARWRNAGLTPPKMERILMRGREFFDYCTSDDRIAQKSAEEPKES
jgi:hypothetical protein